jgi:hypothetical protein
VSEISRVLEKLESIQDDLTEIKVRIAVVENRLDLSKENNIPDRVQKIELFQQRVKVVGGLAMIVVPAVVSVLVKKFL